MSIKSLVLLSITLLAAAHRDHDAEHKDREQRHKHKHRHIWPTSCVVKAPEYFYSCEMAGAVTTRSNFLLCGVEGVDSAQCHINVAPFERIKEVVVAAEHSNSVCAKDLSFLVKDSKIEVKDGCIATFKVVTEQDAEKCDTAKAAIQNDGCFKAVQELQQCGTEISSFCSLPVLQTQPLAVASPAMANWWNEKVWEFVPREIPLWQQREWLPSETQKGIFAVQLTMCLRNHLDALSPQCSETEMMKFLSKHKEVSTMQDLTVAIGHKLQKICLITAIVTLSVLLLCFVWFIAGCLHFWRQYKALKARRGAQKPREGRWSTGLFYCDWRSLVPACLYPMLQTAITQAEVHDRDTHVADVALNLSVSQMITNTYLTRQAIRDRRRLPLAPFKDFLTAIFCLPCAIAQHSRELDSLDEPLEEASQDGGYPQKLASDMI